MRCPQCGEWNGSDRRNCSHCGAPLAGAADVQRRRVDSDARRRVEARETRDLSERAGRERENVGRAFDMPDRRRDVSGHREDMPFRPAYQPQEPKRPKGGIIAAIIVLIAIVLVVLFWFPGLLKGCSSDAGAGADSGSTSPAVGETSDTSTSTVVFDAEKSEAVARDAALDAGKQVLAGTVRATTMAAQAKAAGGEAAEEFAESDEKLILLELEDALSIEARSAADGGVLVKRDDVKSLRLGGSYASLDGQKVTIAVHPADLVLAEGAASGLYAATAESIVVIAPLTAKTAEDAIGNAGTISKATQSHIDAVDEAKKKKDKEEAEAAAQHQAEIEAQWQAEQEAQWQAEQAANNYYVIPDSNWRSLTRSELEGYSTYDLYLARNEIYARNGRLFRNQDLQSYFNSQGWYSGTVSPDVFDTMWMSEVERDNAVLIRQIEEERNSPYL